MTRCLRNRMYPMLVSIVIIAASSIPLIFIHGHIENDPDTKTRADTSILVYPLVAFQGVGIAIMLNTATSLISDVIGSDAENSAFVYGCYSLFDKFANGILLFYLVEGYTNDESALRYIMSIIPLSCAIGSYFFTFIGQKFYSHKMAKITGLKK